MRNKKIHNESIINMLNHKEDQSIQALQDFAKNEHALQKKISKKEDSIQEQNAKYSDTIQDIEIINEHKELSLLVEKLEAKQRRLTREAKDKIFFQEANRNKEVLKYSLQTLWIILYTLGIAIIATILYLLCINYIIENLLVLIQNQDFGIIFSLISWKIYLIVGLLGASYAFLLAFEILPKFLRITEIEPDRDLPIIVPLAFVWLPLVVLALEIIILIIGIFPFLDSILKTIITILFSFLVFRYLVSQNRTIKRRLLK